MVESAPFARLHCMMIQSESAFLMEFSDFDRWNWIQALRIFPWRRWDSSLRFPKGPWQDRSTHWQGLWRPKGYRRWSHQIESLLIDKSRFDFDWFARYNKNCYPWLAQEHWIGHQRYVQKVTKSVKKWVEILLNDSIMIYIFIPRQLKDQRIDN